MFEKKTKNVEVDFFDQVVEELVLSELSVVDGDVVEVMEELESVSSSEED